MSNIHIIFDLDDTFIKTQNRYESIIQEFFEITKLSRLYQQEFWTLHKIRESSGKFRINKMFETMLIICASCSLHWVTELESKIWKLKDRLYDPYEVYPDTLPTLSILNKEYNCTLYVYTLGDYQLQYNKLDGDPNILNYIVDYKVVQEKSRAQLQEYVNDIIEQSPSSTTVDNIWYVGNSMQSDIIPAISCGIKAIHILNRGWSADNNHISCKSPLYFSVNALSEIPLLLDIFDKKDDICTVKNCEHRKNL